MMLGLSHMAWAAFFFRFRMDDTHNSIDFFHLEAGRDRHGKLAACKGICWPLGRINPTKKSYFYISFCVSSNIDAQIKAFLSLFKSVFMMNLKFGI